MKKRVAALLAALILLWSFSSALAAEWTYPVPLMALESDYVRLANRENLLESDYVPDDLVKISAKKTSSTAIQMRKTASEALSAMFDAAKEENLTLYAHSGYRSYRTQRTMYNNRLEDNNGKDDGVVAYPGSSDHQTGLGIDVINRDWIGKRFNSKFASTKEAIWMAENCADFGFIIRYPEGKEDITGIIYEPWHLRYVGVEAARYIMDSGLTLEEFTAEWQAALAEYESQAPAPDEASDAITGQEETPSLDNSAAPTDTPPPSNPIYGPDGDLEVSFGSAGTT